MALDSLRATAEYERLESDRQGTLLWRRWGPYLSERQWGTVREDYSATGLAWEYFPHDHARSRAYRWGEDGIAGLSDNEQNLCLALALWNERDPILKERLFGLTGHEGNHGEDVKEYYFYLDNLPTHAYMKYLYKYPQEAYPYNDLVHTNAKRTRRDPEYELLDTGIFDDDRYFDVFIEYAKANPEEILIQYTVYNRSTEAATLHLMPTLWFRNTWSWAGEKVEKPLIKGIGSSGQQLLYAHNKAIGERWLYGLTPQACLFTENETNNERLYGVPNDQPYVKDAFHNYIIRGEKEAVNTSQGTKAALHYILNIEAGGCSTVRLALSNKDNAIRDFLGGEFDSALAMRKSEADAFYDALSPPSLPLEMKKIQRQAFAGLLWNKQCYHFCVKRWLEGDAGEPTPPSARLAGRDARWPYLDANDIFCMPDKWEYPWFAAWDTAFHCVALALIDPEIAKKQLLLLTREWYMSPAGQIPAYEWNFSDVNPPVQAWAAMRIYQIERANYGRADRSFLERIFQKLLLNFTWWVNRKDSSGRNIFEGGFLGLDNIGAFDRSIIPPGEGVTAQPDATGWMGMFCLNCLQIALELAQEDHIYEDMATKFFEHFVYIADATNSTTGQKDGLWDEMSGFYYGLMTLPDGRMVRLRQDNLAGIIPLFAVATNSADVGIRFPEYRERVHWFVKHRAAMLHNIADVQKSGEQQRFLLAFTDRHKLTVLLQKLLDESQFLSPYGIRSVSKRLRDHPYSINLGGKTFTLDYEPAESTTDLFGGNSNWRGPVWFPLNFLLIESLQKFHYYFGDDLMVEMPTGSGKQMTLWQVTLELTRRLIAIFLPDEQGRRPLYGNIEKFQTDPHWRDYILFHEYFHGDNGMGLGASNQTGWTALVAKLIQQYGAYAMQHLSPEALELRKIGKV